MLHALSIARNSKASPTAISLCLHLAMKVAISMPWKRALRAAMFVGCAAIIASPNFSIAQESRSELREPAAGLRFDDATIDTWHGFRRHRFNFQGLEAWVVEPHQPLPGKPFTWCMMFPDAFTERCAAPAMLERGFYHVYLSVGNTFGCPLALRNLNDFHLTLIDRGFSKQAVLIGISRGGLMAHRYASEYPDFVRLIYGDAPVLDMKSWPGGQPLGSRSEADWNAMKSAYGFTTDAEAMAYSGNPIDTLETLAQHKIPLLYVVGESDVVVPTAYNTDVAIDRYRKLDGLVHVVRKPGAGHHPHGLEDPAPIVAFILRHSLEVPTVPPTPADSK
jgi:pimeloyl-ACP methyl ester carboxylesterase